MFLISESKAQSFCVSGTINNLVTNITPTAVQNCDCSTGSCLSTLTYKNVSQLVNVTNSNCSCVYTQNSNNCSTISSTYALPLSCCQVTIKGVISYLPNCSCNSFVGVCSQIQTVPQYSVNIPSCYCMNYNLPASKKTDSTCPLGIQLAPIVPIITTTQIKTTTTTITRSTVERLDLFLLLILLLPIIVLT